MASVPGVQLQVRTSQVIASSRVLRMLESRDHRPLGVVSVCDCANKLKGKVHSFRMALAQR